MTAKLLAVGLDAAEPLLLRQWMESGDLPVLRALVARGLWADIENYPGFGNGAFWPSVFTGVNPGRHGRYFYRALLPGSYETQIYYEDAEFAATPLWSVLCDAGRRVAVVDPVRMPLMKGINGLQVSEWQTHARAAAVRSWPAEEIDKIIERYGDDPFGGETDARDRTPEGFIWLCETMVARVETKARMVCDYLAKGGWDLFLTCFADPHDIGHTSWHLHDSGHPLYDAGLAARLGDPLKRVYRALDSALGEMIEAAGPGARVLVFGGPGMERNDNANYMLDEVLRRLDGLPPRAGASSKPRGLRAAYRRLVPAGLRRGVRGLAGSAAPSVYAGRRFFTLGHSECAGAIRLNVRGREPDGVIEPAETDAACAELERDLRELVNLDNGEPLVRDVVRLRDICHGPYMDALPDIFVIWRRTGRLSAVASPKIGEVRRDYPGMRTGDHTPRGFVLGDGEGIAAGTLDGKHLPVVIAPTIAAMLGVTMPDADGAALPGFDAVATGAHAG